MTLTAPAVDPTVSSALGPNGERPCLSTEQAAALLGISKWLLLQETNRGNIPHKRIGRRLVYSRRRLLQWVGSEPS